MWFSDEAHFYTNGYVISKNYVFWGSEKHTEVYQKGVHEKKVTAWAAFSHQGIIGPFFFLDDEDNTVTVTSQRYLSILKKFWVGLGRRVGVAERQNQWFQQDGAAPHTSRTVKEWLNRHFGVKVISRGTNHPWSSHSPDLSPLDFHLWGYLKDKMLGQSFDSREDLRDAIIEHVKDIEAIQFHRVIEHFIERIKMCISRKGGHLEHLL